MTTITPNKFTSVVRGDFSGGVNYFYGSRQIADNESPDAINCDFKGKTGVGNRSGYTQVGAVADSRTKVFGLDEYHTASLDQIVKWVSNGSTIIPYHSAGGAWTAGTGNTFSDNLNIDTVQAFIAAASPTPGTPVSTNGYLFTFNGIDAMSKFDGTTVTTHTGGTKGFYGAYYDRRLWCVDEQYQDVVNFSTQTPDATKCLDFTANGTSSNPGTIVFRPGSGEKVTGLVNFKNALYVFLRDAIFRVTTTSTANTYQIELVTNAIGCISSRSVCQCEEDIMFASSDGIYSLGDVANYLYVRTTNKSTKIQQIFNTISSTNKTKLVGKYYNFKYHLFYSLYGTQNDSCAVYDVRYKAWQDWRNMSVNDATLFTTSSSDTCLYFGEVSTGKVHKMTGTTDDGTAISSYWNSKSYTENMSDTLKFYFDTTFSMGALNGTVTFYVIFDDTIISQPVTLSQNKPQGGFGRDTYGLMAFGDETNTVTVTQVVNKPIRLKAKGKNFSIQYKIMSTGDWRLDSISQYVSIFEHFVFNGGIKLN